MLNTLYASTKWTYRRHSCALRPYPTTLYQQTLAEKYANKNNFILFYVYETTNSKSKIILFMVSIVTRLGPVSRKLASLRVLSLPGLKNWNVRDETSHQGSRIRRTTPNPPHTVVQHGLTACVITNTSLSSHSSSDLISKLVPCDSILIPVGLHFKAPSDTAQ